MPSDKLSLGSLALSRAFLCPYIGAHPAPRRLCARGSLSLASLARAPPRARLSISVSRSASLVPRRLDYLARTSSTRVPRSPRLAAPRPSPLAPRLLQYYTNNKN